MNSNFNGINHLAGSIQDMLDIASLQSDQENVQQEASFQYATSFKRISTHEVKTSTNTLWFSNFSQPTQTNNGKKTYVVRIVLNKNDPCVKAIENAITVAMNEGTLEYRSNFNSVNTPLHDGDKECPKGAKSTNYKGKFYIYARSDKLPIVIGGKSELLQDNMTTYSDIPASGCEGPVSIEFYPYCYNGLSGIACSVRALQMLKRCDRLVGDDALNFAKKLFAQ